MEIDVNAGGSWISVTVCTLLAFPDKTKAIRNQDCSRKSSLEDGKEVVVEAGGRRGCAGLLESLPSLVAATGRASGSAIHFYQFASCCIFFSLVFHSLTHAILLFKLLKKDRGHFSQRSTAGACESGRKGKKYIQHRRIEIASTSGQPATQLKEGKK